MTKTETISTSRGKPHQTADREESLLFDHDRLWFYAMLSFMDFFPAQVLGPFLPNPCGGSIMASMASLLRQLHPPVGRRMIACSTWRLDRTIPNSAADYLYRESLWPQLGCEVWHGAPNVLKSIPFAICPHHRHEWDSETIFFASTLRLYMLIYKVLSVHGLDSRRTISMSYHVKTQNIMSIHFFHPRPIFTTASTLRLTLEH